MIGRIIRYFWHLRPRDRVGKPPRMLATDYDSFDDETARIMARLGIRSPSGLKLAMKRHKVSTPQQLIAVLRHHKPDRRMGYRWELLWARLVGGKPYKPHAAALGRALRDRDQHRNIKRLAQRAADSFERKI